MKNVLLPFLLFLFSFTPLSAIEFMHIDATSGLVNPSVIAIAQDSLGRMWFGTENGYSIYNGYTTVSYKPHSREEGTPYFEGERIGKFVSDNQGNVFFYSRKELIRYDIHLDKYEVYSLPNKIKNIYSSHGEVWILINNRLYKWNDQKRTSILFEVFPFDNINIYYVDSKNRTWISTEKGLFVSGIDNKFQLIAPIAGIKSIIETSHHEIWAGSREYGLVRIDKNATITHYTTHSHFNKGFKNNNIREITEDKQGNIWFGTFMGLCKYNYQQDDFSIYTRENTNNSITHSSIYAVYIDNEDIIWLGTYYGGVNYASINNSDITFYTSSDASNQLSSPMVGKMQEDKEGNIWISTEGGGLNMLNPKTKQIKTFKSNTYPYFLPHTNIKDLLYVPQKDLLYIATNGKGLFSYHIPSETFKQVLIGDKADAPLSIINIVLQKDHRLFVSTEAGIFAYDTETKKVSRIIKIDNSRYTFCCIIGNELCVAKNHIIKMYDIDTYALNHAYDLSRQNLNYRIIRFLNTPDGNLFLCTLGNGLLKYNAGKQLFEPFPAKGSPILSDNCYQLIESKQHNLICLGDKGLTIFNHQGEILKHFHSNKYIPFNSITRDNGILQAEDGTIFVGGMNGLISFNEKKWHQNFHPIKPYFSEIYVNNARISTAKDAAILSKALPFCDKIELKHFQNKIALRFSTSQSVYKFDNALFEYRLTGFDNQWNTTISNIITYTNLPTGKFILELREKDATDPHKTLQLAITILPPWYFTWWAILLWCVIILLILYACSLYFAHKHHVREIIRKERYEKEKINEVNEAKIRFFTSVSHEFRTPLTIIMGNIDLILNSHHLPPRVYNKMMNILNQSQLLNQLIEELIEFRKFEQNKVQLQITPCSANALVTSVFERFKDLASQKGIHYTFIPSAEETKIYIDSHQMSRAIMNLLSNAFKFSNAGDSITVCIEEGAANDIRIRISDTGKGIPAKDINRIFERFYRASNNDNASGISSGIGLALVKDIIDYHQASIDVESQVGEGTSFTITLKKGKDHYIQNEHIILNEEPTEPICSDESSDFDTTSKQQEKPLAHDEDCSSAPDAEMAPDTAPTILIVEDNPELLSMLIENFSTLYQVTSATNGKEALEMIRDKRPNLIVSDIMMPEMSGTELCSYIKNDIELCHIPVVLLTALGLPNQQLTGLLKGADDYICKPFNMQILVARCNNLIKSRKLLYQQIQKQPEADLSLLATNNLDKQFLDKVSEIIEQNLTDSSFSNDNLASCMNMSRSSFYNKFKELTGATPNEFINTFRMKKAASHLLQDKEISIAEISLLLGYSTPNYFCRRFKEYYQLSPSQYRAQSAKKEQE